MKYVFGLVVAVGCGFGSATGDGRPNGYCEDDSDCVASDRCVLERELDSHLQSPGHEVVDVERCWPRSTEGDWCTSDDWCEAGLRCVVADCGGAPCDRGLCGR